MNPQPSSLVKTMTIGIRLALGAIFIASCIPKIADPTAFARIVSNYQLLSPPLVATTAILFPWVEAVCGVSLVIGRFEKGAALLISVMMVIFTSIILYNEHRGLNIACGCFSLAANQPSSMAVNALRNLIILAAGAWILFYAHHHRQLASAR